MRSIANVFFLVLALVGSIAFAQQVEVTEDGRTKTAPKVGEEKAREYFGARKKDPESAKTGETNAQVGAKPRYLAIQVGGFFTDDSYRWGRAHRDNVADLNAGVTYRMGEWVNSMDWALRIDYTNFELGDEDARKLSVGAVLTFPDANSRFPLFFGGGLGAGFFLKQIDKESVLALDYSIFGGVRFLDVFENVGIILETGLKNHLHLLSDGQFNGIYLNVGTVFAF